MPETDEDSTKSSKSDLLHQLEKEAFKLTGNEAELKNTKGAKFRPSGYLKVHNTYDNTIVGAPLVQVTARRWFTVKSAYTNVNGYYKIWHEFDNDVNYQMKFNSSYALINSSLIGTVTAYKDGPKKTGSWDYTSWQGMHSYLYKTIMVGVWDWVMVFPAHFGVVIPPYVQIRALANNVPVVATSGGMCTMTKTSLDLLPNTSSGIFLSLFNDIHITDANKDYNILYKTTVHELAHAAHWKSLGSNDATRGLQMIRSMQFVREGWACAFTDHAYEYKFGSWYYNWGCVVELSSQRMIADGYPRMIGQDLWDSYNQFNPTSSFCNIQDNVSGISIEDMFDALQNVGHSGGINSVNYRMNQWKENLKTMHPAQAAQINAYFGQYWKN